MDLTRVITSLGIRTGKKLFYIVTRITLAVTQTSAASNEVNSRGPWISVKFRLKAALGYCNGFQRVKTVSIYLARVVSYNR